MTVYMNSFFNHIEIKNNQSILHLKANGVFKLSWSLISQLSQLRSYSFQSDWIDVSLSKNNLYGMNCDDFTEDDWAFIRTIYSVFAFGKYVRVEMFVHYIL